MIDGDGKWNLRMRLEPSQDDFGAPIPCVILELEHPDLAIPVLLDAITLPSSTVDSLFANEEMFRLAFDRVSSIVRLGIDYVNAQIAKGMA